MELEKEVKFLRRMIDEQDAVRRTLAYYYQEGWRVVSHTEHDAEYSFVLERDKVTVAAIVNPGEPWTD